MESSRLESRKHWKRAVNLVRAFPRLAKRIKAKQLVSAQSAREIHVVPERDVEKEVARSVVDAFVASVSEPQRSPTEPEEVPKQSEEAINEAELEEFEDIPMIAEVEEKVQSPASGDTAHVNTYEFLEQTVSPVPQTPERGEEEVEEETATAEEVVSAGGVEPGPGSPAEIALLAEVKKKPKLNKFKFLRRVVKKEKEIDRSHKLYHLCYGMMLGIRSAVGGQDVLSASQLRMDDFMHVDKFVFPPQGSSKTPPHKLQHEFKFKDYAPRVFRHLRKRFGINDADYMLSVCGDFNFIEFISNSKSGQFFFYTHDAKFMIKTQTRDESRFLRRILAHYYQYVMANPNTLMTRFYGMHRVKMHHLGKKLHFVVMQSVFAGDKEIHKTFDLKGSLINRKATAEDKKRGKGCVYKDLDLQEAAAHGKKLRLGPRKAMLLEQLKNDVAFLTEMKIMDYSLLVGIHHRGQAHQPGRRRRSVALTGQRSVRGIISRPDHRGQAPALRKPGLLADTRKRRHSTGSIEELAAALRAQEEKEDSGAPVIRPHHPVFTLEDGGVHGVDRFGSHTDEIYYMGIIDILQQFNARKRGEYYYKSLRHDWTKVSAVPPKYYGERFLHFLDENCS